MYKYGDCLESFEAVSIEIMHFGTPEGVKAMHRTLIFNILLQLYGEYADFFE